MKHTKRRNHAWQGVASEIVNLCGVDRSELTLGASLNQVARKIALKGRVSRFYASALAEIMEVRR